jgi:hypothetical protein
LSSRRLENRDAATEGSVLLKRVKEPSDLIYPIRARAHARGDFFSCLVDFLPGSPSSLRYSAKKIP